MVRSWDESNPIDYTNLDGVSGFIPTRILFHAASFRTLCSPDKQRIEPSSSVLTNFVLLTVSTTVCRCVLFLIRQVFVIASRPHELLQKGRGRRLIHPAIRIPPPPCCRISSTAF